MSDIGILHRALMAMPPGDITEKSQIKKIEEVLSICWDIFFGASETKMEGYKIVGRMEELVWEPPFLSFKIERHGRTVNASTRADIHQWILDVERTTAKRKDSGFRQLSPMDKRFNAKITASEIVEIILSGAEDPRLDWNENRQIVKVNIGMVVPDGNAKSTAVGRRKRFREECVQLLNEHGWKTINFNKYQRPNP